VQGKIKIEAIN